jgi:hypothetical protein
MKCMSIWKKSALAEASVSSLIFDDDAILFSALVIDHFSISLVHAKDGKQFVSSIWTILGNEKAGTVSGSVWMIAVMSLDRYN